MRIDVDHLFDPDAQRFGRPTLVPEINHGRLAGVERVSLTIPLQDQAERLRHQ